MYKRQTLSDAIESRRKTARPLLSHDKSGERVETRVNHSLLNRAGNARLRTTQEERGRR